jgi:hypothetical protein
MWLTIGFGAVVASAVIGLPTWPRALVEACLIVAVVALVFAHAPFRSVLAATSRQLRLGALAVTVLWGWSQIRGVQFATYPFMSWRMYGESLGASPAVGYRVMGVECDGRESVVPQTGRTLGPRPILATGIRRAFNQSLADPSRAASALARTDSLLGQMIRRLNTDSTQAPLCSLLLQRVAVPVHTLSSQPLPPYTTVRRYDVH